LLNPQCTLTIGGAGVSACTDQLIPYEVGTPPRVIYATYDSSDANHATASNNTPITVVKGTQGAISLVFSALPATYGQTGVEMEALTAASVAALTVYDMCKAIDRGMRVEALRVVAKSGGKSGAFRQD